MIVTVKIWHRAIIEFFIKVVIMCIVAIILGAIDAVVECVFMKDISLFIHFTMGYSSCLIFNWRWFIWQEEKEKRK